MNRYRSPLTRLRAGLGSRQAQAFGEHRGTDATSADTTGAPAFGPRAPKLGLATALTLGLATLTYLLAANPQPAAAQADPCPNAEFRTGPSAHLPDCRAYEMVSPLDKNGGDIDRDLLENLFNQSGAAPSGDAVAFTSRAHFAEIESGTLRPNYVARRGETGWATEGISPPIANPTVQPNQPTVAGLSLDLSKAFVRTDVLLTPDAGTLNGSRGLYMRTSGQADRYSLVSVRQPGLVPDDPETSRTFANSRFEYEASTPGARQVLFNSTRRLLEEGPADGTSTPNAVYEWVDGGLRLASMPPPGLSLGSGIVVAGGGGQRLSSGALHGDNVISDDGRRVFFTAPLEGFGGAHLFVREDGAVTRLVSRSERAGDDPVAPGGSTTFWAAKKADGAVAFFTNSAPLTEGAGNNSLYRWDANAPEGQALTELTPHPDGEPNVQGPAAVSDDATSVYFMARGVLAEGATDGEPNLYLWRQGEGVRFIATLAGGSFLGSRDNQIWDLSWRQGGRAARVSADGERLVFASFAQLDPSYDTTEASPEACGSVTVGGQSCRQIYMYDAPSDKVSCLTCVAGVPLSGDANLFGNSEPDSEPNPTGQAVTGPLQLPRNLSADGSRAFFETTRRLVPEDNNTVLDVYEWVDADLDGEGELHLISSGQSATESQFLDASMAGDDVFFTTRDRLVGIDSDNHVDLYDARVGGGIAAQNPVPRPRCIGDVCQGGPSTPPPDANPGSGGFVGPGNPAAGAECDALAAKAKKAAKKAKRLKRRSRRASGSRADKLAKKARKAKRSARRLERKAELCERGDS